MTEPSKLLTEPSPHATYLTELDKGRIPYQQCRTCDNAFVYPRVLCPNCGSTELSWKQSDGVGTIYSSTITPQRDAAPYNICLVDLDEGFRVMSTIVESAPENVVIGSRVHGRVDGTGEDARVVFTVEVDDDASK